MLGLFKQITFGDDFTRSVSFDCFLALFKDEEDLYKYVLNEKELMENLSEYFYINIEEIF